MKKTLIAFILVLAAGFASFTACEKSPPAESTESSESNHSIEPDTASVIDFIKDGSSEYIIVRSDNAEADEINAAAELKNAIKDKLNVEMAISTDFEKRNADPDDRYQYEILVGATNRAESQSVLSEIGRYDFAVRVINGKIVIIGGMEQKTHEAVKYFIGHIENIQEGNNMSLDADFNYTYTDPDDPGIYWEDDIITVYKPSSGGAWYPRMLALADGSLLCAFDINGGYKNSVIKIMKSTDSGLSWEELSVIDYYPDLNCANPALIELENGDIWLSHRANSGRYTSIQNNISRDGGKTWEHHSLIDEQRGNGGVYEPHFGRLGDTVAVFYANDSHNRVTSDSEQNIEFRTWQGDKWSDVLIASDGTKTKSRDGMPVWDIREDGRYVLAVEATNVSGFPFVLQIKSSPDGCDWSEELRTIYIPHTKGRKAAAPYILTLPDGRLLLSFQTDEDAGRAGDNYSIMKIMMSADKTGEVWYDEPFVPFDIPDGYCANWNGLYLHDSYVYAVTSTNYPDDGIYLRRASLSK